MNKIRPPVQIMPFGIRSLREADILQSSRIERDSFPSPFQPTSFHRELKNKLSSYLIAWQKHNPDKTEYETQTRDCASPNNLKKNPVTNLLKYAVKVWDLNPSRTPSGQDTIVGFVGTWLVSNEAHIVSIAVSKNRRGRGIGELLLISAIEQAVSRHASHVTLEVRASNHIALKLYKKYGFKRCGIRKSYYHNNHEDAIIMTVDSIQLPPFTRLLQKLRGNHCQRWGQPQTNPE